MGTPECFYVAGGSLRADAPSYVERRADTELYEGLLRGEFCYVLTPRQMGKSSLMVRTAARLRADGVQVVVLDLTAIGRNVDAEQWYYGLLDHLAEQTGLETEMEAFWQEHERLGPLQRFLAAIRQVALPRCAGPLVICVDEIDVVRSLPFSTDEFFAGIRECYNRRTENPALERLTFCLLGAAAPTDLVQDTRITPFNIGRRIELTDFTPEEAAPLAHGLTGKGTGEEQEGGAEADSQLTSCTTHVLARVLYWTAGHPYLTQRLCKAAAQARACSNPYTPRAARRLVDRLCSERFLSSGARQRDDNLLFVRDRLLRSDLDLAALLDLYSRVWRGRRVPDDEADPRAGLLRLSGIVRAQEGRLRVRNRIYAQVFDANWARDQMPGAEVRRQRAAYRRGVLRAASVATGIVLVMGILVATSVRFARRAEKNRQSAERSHAEADRQTRAARRLARDLQAALGQKDVALGKVEDAVWAEKARAAEAQTASAVARRERDHARRERARADSEAQDSRERLTRLIVADGVRTLETDDSTGALLYFVKTLQMDHGNAAREAVDRLRIGAILAQTPRLAHRWSGILHGEISPDGRRLLLVDRPGTARIWDADRGTPLTPAMTHGSALQRALFSPDRRKVLTLGGVEARVWDADTGQPLAPPLVHGKAVWDAAWSPDSRRVVTGSWDRGVRVWEPDTGRTTAAFVDRVYHEGVRLVRFSPDGKAVAECHHEVLVVRNAENLQPEFQWTGSGSDVQDLQFSPDSRRIAVGGSVGAAVIDAFTGRPLTPRMDVQDIVNSVCFSPDGRHLATIGFIQQAQVWDAVTGEPVGPAMEHRSDGRSVVYSADGRFIVTTTADDGSRFWDARTNEPVTPVLHHGIGGAGISVSADGRRLLVWSNTRVARLWEITGPVLKTLHQHGTCASFSPDGKRVLAGTIEGARVYDAVTGREACPPLAHPGRVHDALFTPDSHRVVTGGEDGTARVWDTRTGRPLLTLSHPVPVRGLALSTDGRWLAVAAPPSVHLWDLSTRSRVRVSGSAKEPLAGAGFSPDVRRMAVAGMTGLLRIEEIGSGRRIATIRHAAQLTAASFSPDGRRVVTANLDHIARVWDSGTGRPLTPPLPHPDMVSHACFSPDGRRLATACGGTNKVGGRDARVWDATTGRAVLPALPHRLGVRHAAFSRDGRLIVTSGADGCARVWDTATGDPVTPPLRMPGQVYYAEISRDNRHVLAASNDGTVRLWPLPVARGSAAQLMALAERLSDRRLDVGGGLTYLEDAFAANTMIPRLHPSLSPAPANRHAVGRRAR